MTLYSIFILLLAAKRIKNVPEPLLFPPRQASWGLMTFCILCSFFPLWQKKKKNAAGKEKENCLFGISESMTLIAVILPNTRKQSLCKQSITPASDLQMAKQPLSISFSEAWYVHLTPLISILRTFMVWVISILRYHSCYSRHRRHCAWGGYFHTGRIVFVTTQFAAGDVVRHTISAILTSSQ